MTEATGLGTMASSSGPNPKISHISHPSGTPKLFKN